MDRLESMTVLVAVAQAGSFSEAGRRLRMPLPTVSRKVAELEAHLKAKLLLRTTRKLALTEVGQPYVAACRRILEELAEAERGAAGEYGAPRGDLVLTAPIVFGRLHVLPVTTEFLQAYPAVNVRLLMTDRQLDLIDEHLDLAVRIGDLPDSRMVAIRLGGVRRVVCASPAYFAARGVPRTPDDLAMHDCVTFPALPGPETWAFGAGRSMQTVRTKPRLVVNTAEAAIDAAVAGVGLTRVLSYQVREWVNAGRLTLALRRFEPEPVPVSLVYAGENLMPRKLRAFLDFATPRLKARLRTTIRG